MNDDPTYKLQLSPIFFQANWKSYKSVIILFFPQKKTLKLDIVALFS